MFKTGLWVFAVLLLAACSASSLNLPPDTTTAAESEAVFCAMYLNTQRFSHNSSSPETNQISWGRHVSLARNLTRVAPRQIEGAVWDYLHAVETQALQAEQFDWVAVEDLPVSAQQILNHQLRGLQGGVNSLASFGRARC
jgi:hypothetical protein